MKGESACIKCKKPFKWKRGTEQYKKYGIPKWCSTDCRRTIFEKNFDFDGITEGILKCKWCQKDFEWKASKHTLEYRGKPKYCSRSCLARDTQKTKSFSWDKLTEEQKIERLRKSFEKKVEKKDGCWEWKSALQGKYGIISYFNGHIGAHRASWIIYKGEIPENLWVLHKCDNPLCTNPDHLFLGTPKDNAQDRQNKNRGQKGITHHKCKLNDDDVREIKKRLSKGEKRSKLAKEYEVTHGTIWFIENGVTWTHIN